MKHGMKKMTHGGMSKKKMMYGGMMKPKKKPIKYAPLSPIIKIFKIRSFC